MVSDKKEKTSLVASESKLKQQRICDDRAWIARVLGENPDFVLTVRATLEAKLRKAHERLYRGDRTLGQVAAKHVLSAVQTMTGCEASDLINIPNWGDICRNLMLEGCKKPPSWALPSRGMLVCDFLNWVGNLHEAAGHPLKSFEPMTTDMISGIHIGPVRFLKPAAGRKLVEEIKFFDEKFQCTNTRILYNEIIDGTWQVTDNYSRESAKLYRAEDESQFNISQRYDKFWKVVVLVHSNFPPCFFSWLTLCRRSPTLMILKFLGMWGTWRILSISKSYKF